MAITLDRAEGIGPQRGKPLVGVLAVPAGGLDLMAMNLRRRLLKGDGGRQGALVRGERIAPGAGDRAQRVRALPRLPERHQHGRAKADVAAPPLDDEADEPAPRPRGIHREEQAAPVGVPTRRCRFHERSVQALFNMRSRPLPPPDGGRAVGAQFFTTHSLPHISAATEPGTAPKTGGKNLMISDTRPDLEA